MVSAWLFAGSRSLKYERCYGLGMRIRTVGETAGPRAKPETLNPYITLLRAPLSALRLLELVIIPLNLIAKYLQFACGLHMLRPRGGWSKL